MVRRPFTLLETFSDRFEEIAVRPSHVTLAGDEASERRKLDLVRIGAGIVALIRTGWLAWGSYYYFAPVNAGSLDLPREFILSLLMLLLILLFTIGFFTPVVTLLLILTYNVFDVHVWTATLGTTIWTLLLVVLLLAGSGLTCSFDAYLMRRGGRGGALLRRIYSLVGVPDAGQRRVLHFTLFTGYALTNFGAVWHHLNDAYWVQGRTISVIFTNSYLSEFYPFFRALERWSPAALRALSISLIAFQTLFQLFMFPLMYWRWGAHFVKLWGAVFFVGSAVLLQLSYLPYMQMLIWVILFLPSTLLLRGERDEEPVARKRPKVAFAIILTGLLAIQGLFVLQFPIFPPTRLQHGWIKKFLYNLGYNFPVVFNQADLKLGDYWPVITRHDSSGEVTRVPFNNPLGGRDWYHRSDVLYFGNSVRWRRHGIGKDPRVFNGPDSEGRHLIRRVIDFDARLNRQHQPRFYEVQIFGDHSSDVRFPLASRYEPVLQLTYRETLDTGSATAR